MATVELTDEEWQQVMNILISAHPLLMKIGGQLRQQQETKQKTNSQEMPANQGEVVSSRAN